MSPFDATATSDGWLKVSLSLPVTPALPRVRSCFPSGLNLITWWPLPSLPRASVTQTLPSGSTWMPWGNTKRPPAKLFTSLPSASNLRSTARLESPQLFAPHLSATQIDRPSRSISTALVDPQVRPSGILAQPSTVEYGLGWEFGDWASAVPTDVVTTIKAATSAFRDRLWFGMAVFSAGPRRFQVSSPRH